MLLKAQLWLLRKTVGIGSERVQEVADFPLCVLGADLRERLIRLVAGVRPHHNSPKLAGLPIFRTLAHGLSANLDFVFDSWVWGVKSNLTLLGIACK